MVNKASKASIHMEFRLDVAFITKTSDSHGVCVAFRILSD